MTTFRIPGWGALALLLCGCIVAQSQSLGEVARQQRITNAKTPHHSRVITNEDIPASSSPDVGSTGSQEEKEDSPAKSSKAKDRKAASAAALQAKIKALKRHISELKAHLVDLQEQMDQWNHDYSTNIAIRGSPAVSCLVAAYQEWCDRPKRLQADAERTQAQIEADQRELEETQEVVRRMGYGNAFYDPE